MVLQTGCSYKVVFLALIHAACVERNLAGSTDSNVLQFLITTLRQEPQAVTGDWYRVSALTANKLRQIYSSLSF